MYWILTGVLLLLYLLLNLYVKARIEEAHYLDEGRRRVHRWLIWLIPFLGPYMIRGFWKKREEEGIEVVTKEERRRMRKRPLFGGLFGFIPGPGGGPGGGGSDLGGPDGGGSDGGGGGADGGGGPG